MPIDLDDVKALAEHTLVSQIAERMKRLVDEKVEVIRNGDEATNRLQQINNELNGLEARLRGIAAALRAVLNRIDPPGPPGP